MFLSVAVQPWLLYSEAQWLRKDPITFGYIADPLRTEPGFTLTEDRAAHQFSVMLKQALDGN
jgi:hypothetical protein